MQVRAFVCTDTLDCNILCRYAATAMRAHRSAQNVCQNSCMRPASSLWQDLETRKRAPLYQKKQEEELRAAAEKAVESELRMQDAELRCKEAKVRGIHCMRDKHPSMHS